MTTTVDFERFCKDFDVVVAVVSRDRAETLARYTDRMASATGYVLFHSGDGYDDHEYRCSRRVEVPRGIVGRPATLNYALRHLDERIVICLDDDLNRVYWLGGTSMFRLAPELVPLMLMNLVVNALDLGVSVFGINEGDIRKASPLIPFHTRAMVAALIGVIGRELWFDERNMLKADYDFCLQSIKAKRMVFKDLRYFLAQDRNNLPGGTMSFRTVEREEAEVENLKAWWGSDVISWSLGKGTKKLAVRVP